MSTPVSDEEVRLWAEAFDAFAKAVQAINNRPPSLTTGSVIELYYAQKPILIWHVGKDILPQIQKLKGDDGRYLYQHPSLDSTDQFYKLLGHPIKIVEGGTLRLVTVGGNRK